MIHDMITTWFHLLENWGYFGVFILMAMESSIIPIPSELVMPPAAFWAAQGRMDFWMVVFMGTAGSYVGSAISYWTARILGTPVVHRFGKYVFLTEEKLVLSENWIRKHGVFGIFVARLLPVMRHLVSIPAGLFRMSFLSFSIVTTIGAGLWCWVLAWFGREVLGDRPELLNSPAEMVSVMKDRMSWFVIAVFGLLVLYVVFVRRKKHAH